MSDLVAVLLIAYVQFGTLVAWYLFYRRVLALRDDFAVEIAAREGSLRELENAVGRLRRQIRDLAGSRTLRSRHRESQLLQQAKRRGALEMARRGMEAHHIAETLDMRRAEVELLLRLERLQKDVYPQAGHGAASWLGTTS